MASRKRRAESDDLISVETAKASDLEKFEPFSVKTWKEDLMLIVEDKNLYVNKAILAYVSPVFARMFESCFKEKTQWQIPLPGKKYDDVVEFLQCIYPSSSREVTEENVCVVLPLADEYQVELMITKCKEVLLHSVTKLSTTERLFQYINMACLYDFNSLEEKCISIVSERNPRQLELGEAYCPIPLGVKCKIQDKMIAALVSKQQLTVERLELYDCSRFISQIPEAVIKLDIHLYPRPQDKLKSAPAELMGGTWLLAAKLSKCQTFYRFSLIRKVANDDFFTFRAKAYLKTYCKYAPNEEADLSEMDALFSRMYPKKRFPDCFEMKNVAADDSPYISGGKVIAIVHVLVVAI